MIKQRTARAGLLALALAGLHTGNGWAATYFQETFETYADDAAVTAGGWTINDNSPASEADWTITNPGGRPVPFGGTGKFMVSDDDQGADGGDVNEELITPAINLTAATTVWLHFATFSEPNDNGDTINNVDVSNDGGATWTTVWTSASPTVGAASTFDVDGITVIDGTSDGRSQPVHKNITSLAAGKASVKVRFHHLNATDDWYWTVDNVVVDDQPPFAGGADVLLATETFEADPFPPTGWEIIRQSPNLDGNNPWLRDDVTVRNAGGISGNNTANRIGPDHFAILDSDMNPDADPEDEILRTPIINATGYAKLYLHFDSEIKFNVGKTIADIEVSGDGGTSWSTLYSYDYRTSPTYYRSGEVYYDDFVLDASVAAGSATLTFRFRYRGNGDEWWWAVDNVKVTGTKGVVVVQEPPAKPTLTAPTAVSFFDTAIPFSGSAFSDPNAGDSLASTIWQFSTTSTFNESSGLASVQQEVAQAGSSTTLNTGLNFTTPGVTVYATVQYVDASGLKSKFADVKTLTVSPLPTPFAFENFESTSPGAVPTGWVATNDTTEIGLDEDINVLSSKTYENWTVIPYDVLNTVGNPADQRGTGPVDGQSIYAESDTRSGSQIQVLTTPDFNATGKNNVWVVFKSNYVQNQDNINALEYSVDQGATWLPILYMVETADLIRNPSGQIDGEGTLSAVRGDQAAPTNPETGERVAASYGTFVLARPLADLGPYIQGRINDDKVESKRLERYRLTAADNKATVRFRFMQAGTGSWWWGVDDFGLYEASAGPTPTITASVSALTDTTMTISWTGGTGKFLVQKKNTLTDATWTNYMTTTTSSATVPISGATGFFRIQEQYTGPDIVP